MERLHNMKSVEVRTGLSAHLIRVWEKRYNAVNPCRSCTRRRMYSEEEVARLTVLARLTKAGRNIGQIARLPMPELEAMVSAAGNGSAPAEERCAVTVSRETERFIGSALDCVRGFDVIGLEKALDEAVITLGHSGLLERVLVPLLRRIGEDWRAGLMTAAQEHGATSAIRDYLARAVRPMGTAEDAPRLLVTTPAGQLHEMGAAIAAALARKAGWNVAYLGPSLPAEEIVGAVRVNHCRALALSIVYPVDDPLLPDQLVRLRGLLPDGMPVIVGGRAVDFYRGALDRIGAIVVGEMGEFTEVLEAVREGRLQPAFR